jgi:hypothetical protein
MHYETYKTRCEAGKIAMSDWAIPRPMWKEMERKNTRAGVAMQCKLDDHIELLSAPKVFTREGVLDAIARHIICDDQVRDTRCLVQE